MTMRTQNAAGRAVPRGGRRKKVIWISVFFLILIAAALGVYFFVFAGKALGPGASGSARPISKSAVLQAWNSGDKEAALNMTRSSLEIAPIDPFYLSFNGIAAYYLSADKPEGDERQSLLDEAVFSLRKAMASGKRLPVKAQVEYVLGKAYFQKGSPWYDLAAKYLRKSREDGYEGQDTEQYLGLSYAGLQNHAEAVKHFEAAILAEPSDVLMLSAAISYKELGDLQKTSDWLSKATASAQDALIVQRARFMLGEMAMDAGDLQKAKEIYQSVVETDPRSAEGWYRLGLVAEAQKDPIAARADWRKATAIDPQHIEARKKLGERL